jgi:hypothetical protein
MHFSRKHATWSCHLSLLDLIIRMIFCGSTPWISSVGSVVHAPITASLVSTNIFCSIFFSNTLSLLQLWK